jgi:L-ascorbate metabolism protein UlaG (beta-lactamase superfamily)
MSVSSSRAARWARRLAQETRRKVEPAPFIPRPAGWSDNRITLAWLGHSTVLVNFYGIRILTDPALAKNVGISYGLGTIGPKRFVAPALTSAQLPPIDVVLLSHAHMDHMDLPTMRLLGSTPAAVTARTTRDLLVGTGLKHITELGWGERVNCRTDRGDLQIEAFEVKHWGQRWPSELPRGYNGYILRREGRAILFGGDTALTPTLGDIKSRGPFAVAIMPIGAYRPWIWNHCTPEEALSMANAARAKFIVPVHHQTFRLSEEPRNEPIERLAAALEREPERMAVRQIGQTFEVPSA